MAKPDPASERTCIATREVREPDELIRFVLAPDGQVVPDLKRKLPGRGAHTVARREAVDEAMRRKLFSRAFRAETAGPADLGARVDGLLVAQALGALGLARKAGVLVMGAAKVEAALAKGGVTVLVQASDGSPDGLAKMAGIARRTAFERPGNAPRVHRLFTADELGLALGGGNVIHAAVLAGHQGSAAAKRLATLAAYRGVADPDEAARCVVGAGTKTAD